MAEQPGETMFQRRAAPSADPAALDRVEALVRARYKVAEEDIVLVSEEPGRTPGFPGRMTTILFWEGSAARHRLRLFKPAAQVTEADLPEGWLKKALRDEGDGDCC